MEKCRLSGNITAKRIVLKERSHDHDVDMWRAIDGNREFLREYLFWVDGTKNLENVASATNMFARMWARDENFCYSIYSLEDNRFLGCIDAHNLSFMSQKAEIGYWLKEDETGKGYMKEAVEALENALFEAGFHRLEIHCDINNKKSWVVAQRCGYALESVAREALYHYTGLHHELTYVKFSPYPIKGF